VFVASDVSVYDPAMSDSLILMGYLIETGFTVMHRIPTQAKEDGFSLKTVPLYGSTIMTPDGKTIIVMEHAQHTWQFTAACHFSKVCFHAPDWQLLCRSWQFIQHARRHRRCG